ncbi:MAG: hypothetical protein M9929_05755 [Burkholderiaceae bacterium]|nr:hypothetical protein [Burkholderiaceae bacterium]
MKGKALWSTLYWQGRPAGEIFKCVEAVGYRPLPDGATLTLGGATGDGVLATPPNCLRVTLRAARGLLTRGMARETCNPYVWLDAGEFTVRSAVRSSETSPTWDEGWAFPIVERATTLALALEVNHSRTLGPAVFEGRVNLMLSDFDARRGEVVRAWYPLTAKDGSFDKRRGEVDVEICWEFKLLFATLLTAASGGGAGRKVTLEPLRLDAKGAPIFPRELMARLGGSAAAAQQQQQLMAAVAAVQGAVQAPALTANQARWI